MRRGARAGAARLLTLAAALALTVPVGAAPLPVPARAAQLPVALAPGATRGPVAVYDTTREAITVPPAASFTAHVDAIPFAGRVLTAVAVPAADPGTPSAAVRFRISFVNAVGADVLLYERDVDPAAARDRRWIDVGVPLDALVGQSGTLRFDVTPVAAREASVTSVWWAPPELVSCAGDAPSLLLITIDALRGDHLGSAGYARPTTPYLDAFAADATRFNAAFAGGPKTIPSVPQILTGRWFYWHRPARGLPALLGDGARPSRAIIDNPYVAGWLRGEQPGFDVVEAGDFDARAITVSALRYLTAAGRCPNVLFLHYLDTHTPYHAPARYARRFVDRRAATTIGLTFDDVTGAWQDRYGSADRQRIVDLYDGSLAYVDRELGRLMRGLARRGRLDRTLVVVTADHGEEFWDHRKFFHGQSLYDELLHVPLLVRWPGVGHGRVVADVVRTVDLAPTIAEALGHTAPESDGRSLRPLATGDADASRTAFALVSHAEPRTPERQAARTATQKIIRDVSDGAIQIYDLTTDPKEKRNLGPAAPGAAELVQTLDGFRAGLDGKGYQLRVRGPRDRTVRYTLALASEPPFPLIAIDRLTLEAGDLVDFRPRSSAFAVVGTLTPGDEDQVRFDALATTGVLKLTLQIDGAPAHETPIRLGANAAAGGAVVDLADPRLDGAPPPAPAPDGVVVDLWRAAAATPARAAAPTLDDATRERLRQLGYVE